MRRGTTPTHTFLVDLDLTAAQVIYITYSQQNTPVLSKEIGDITVSADSLVTRLTQAETLQFKEREVEIQIRARFSDGTAVASNIIKTTAERILKDGVI